jgi:hypothetical protein
MSRSDIPANLLAFCRILGLPSPVCSKASVSPYTDEGNNLLDSSIGIG